MNELKVAANGAFHLLVVFVLSRMLEPAIDALVPAGGELLQEAVVLLVTAFIVGLAEAILWGQPEIIVEWSDHGNRERLARIDIRVAEAMGEGSLLKIAARGYAEKPLARWFLGRLAKQGFKLEVIPKHAPVIFTVETSSRTAENQPLAIVRAGARGVDLVLAGDPPSRGGIWVWAKGRFTARELLPGDDWDVDYKLVCSSFVSNIVARFLSVRSDVGKLTIQSL